MKNRFLILWIMILSTNQISHAKTTDSATLYFPIQVGNIWYYEDPDTTINPWDILTISDSIQINSQKYYLWERGSGANVSDTIRYDSDYNVLRYIDGEIHLWFDFTQDSGAVYTYAPPDADFGEEEYAYQVHVYRNITVATPLKSFSNCIEFLFDIPQVIDEEHIYIFAPDVGLVIEQANGWWTKSLHDYTLYSTPTGVNDRKTIIHDFHLYQNYPNPFNPSTTFRYTLPVSGMVNLHIYNLIGQEIETLVHSRQSTGTHEIIWTAELLPSGIYFFQINIGNHFSEMRKMILLK